MSKDNENTQYNLSEVNQIVHKTISKISTGSDETKVKVHSELKDLVRLINTICHKMSDEQDEIHSGKGDISRATAELGEVVVATEKATGEIMDACEAIQGYASDIDEVKKTAILDETNKIFESCSFQDITGQRVSNAVKALYEIEKRIDSLIGILNQDGHFKVDDSESEDTRSEDEKLMNGPQMTGKEMSQEDIDKLLADF